MELQRALTQFQADFETVLAEFLESCRGSVCRIGGESVSAYERIKAFSLQEGKRLRPFLMFLTYRGYGGRNDKAILKACCSVEMMQSSLLISDDIMDRSDLRRGHPTLHRTFQSDYTHLGESVSAHMGMSVAILASDIAMAYGALALSRSDFDPDLVSRALGCYCEVVADEGYGQFLDLKAEAGGILDEESVLAIYQYKTTRYTVEGPMHLGAILAGADGDELASLSRFALPAGAIYQLQDDILGLFGDEEQIGKPADSDVKEGKQTLLIVKALERASGPQQEVLNEALGNQDLTVDQLSQVRSIVISTGAFDYAKRQIQKWEDSCRAAAMSSSLSTDIKEYLVEFTGYLANREH